MFLSITKQLKRIPQTPGVYLFSDAKKKVLYVGKATNLQSRVQSYFSGHDSRGERIIQLMQRVSSIDFKKTDSVLEALILESQLIKKYQPKYNSEGKDDKSFTYFVITNENFPRVLIVHETDLPPIHNRHSTTKGVYGPYTSRKQMEIALKIVRRIFCTHARSQKTEKGCLDYQIGLCPGPYDNAITKKEYGKNIHGIAMILQGKKKKLVRKLEKEMKDFAKKEEFEKAEEVRRKVFALNHIRDVALLTNDQQLTTNNKSYYIEGYDISNISGHYAVGSMVVFENDVPKKSAYRKFKMKFVKGIKDVSMMREVLARRLQHKEWRFPDLILLDGGKGHLNMARKLLKDLDIKNIQLMALAKGPTRKKVEFHWIGRKRAIEKNVLVSVRDEAHRFALTYHKKLRDKIFSKRNR